MDLTIGNYLVTAFAAGAGFAATYVPLSQAIRWLLHRTAPPSATPAGADRSRSAPELAPDQARELIARLHGVATRMSHDVGQHSEAMRQIDVELSHVDAQGGEKALEVVLAAVDRIAEANGHLTEKLTTAQNTIEEQGDLLEAHMADALTDALTSIANRRAFDHEITRRHSEWTRRRTPFSLVMLDVDHFKKFNDTHGHQAGDEVLRGVARALSVTVRDMDLVARYGGEEFSVILPDTDLENATPAAERIREAVKNVVLSFEGKTLRVTASVGLAQIADREPASALIRRADEALYASKEAGRNCSHYSDGEACHRIGEPRVDDSASEPTRTQTVEAGSSEPEQSQLGPPQPDAESHAPPLLETADILSDAQTGLPTQRALETHLRRRIAEWQRFEVPMSAVVLELDEFDQIERLGESATRFVVDVSARLLLAGLRDMDFVARTGPGRFTIVLPSCTMDDAVVPTERVRRAIAACDKLKHEGSTVRFTISAGIAEITSADDTTSLIGRATAAMARAATKERNSIYVHDGAACKVAANVQLV